MEASTLSLDLFESDLVSLGLAANQAAAASVFPDFQARKAANTLRRHRCDLAAFNSFLAAVGAQSGDLAGDPEAWRGITWGLLVGFMRWQLLQGYAISTANLRLSSVKTYAALASQAGVLDPGELALIRTVKGYGHKEIRRVDEKRRAAGIDVRKGSKKAGPVIISRSQARALKEQPADLPQGRRDRLLMCLLLDHGLRCGEVKILTVSNFDLSAGELQFYRPKVSKLQRHRLSADTLRAAGAYIPIDAPASGFIWRRSNNDGSLGRPGLSERGITDRVKVLGESVGLQGLSAHDCRHYWATAAARNGTPIDRLQDAGGWNSSAMPMRYIEAAAIANQGVILD